MQCSKIFVRSQNAPSGRLAGQLAEDPKPGVFLVYPEGNWVEIDRCSPSLAPGSTAYAKPILDWALTYETPMATALKLACRSFDFCRFSSTDVGSPIRGARAAISCFPVADSTETLVSGHIIASTDPAIFF